MPSHCTDDKLPLTLNCDVMCNVMIMCNVMSEQSVPQWSVGLSVIGLPQRLQTRVVTRVGLVVLHTTGYSSTACSSSDVTVCAAQPRENTACNL